MLWQADLRCIIASQKPEGWLLVPDRYDDGPGVTMR
jgi:hypothetical protein